MFTQVDDETVLHTDDPVTYWYKARQIEFNIEIGKDLVHVPQFIDGKVTCKNCGDSCDHIKTELDFNQLEDKDSTIFFHLAKFNSLDHVFTPDGLLYTTVGSLPEVITELYFRNHSSNTIVCRNRLGQWNDTSYGEKYSDFLRHWIKDPEVTLTMDCNGFHRNTLILETPSAEDVDEETLKRLREHTTKSWNEITTIYQSTVDKVSKEIGKSSTPKGRTRNRDKNRKVNKLARKARRK